MVAEKRGRGEVIQIYATRRGHRMRGIQVDRAAGWEVRDRRGSERKTIEETDFPPS